MLRRWLSFLLCISLSVLSVLMGWLVPAHLRATDVRLLQRAGKNSRSLLEVGNELLNEKRLGAAEILYSAAESLSFPGRQALESSITNLATQHSSWSIWGGGEPDLEVIFSRPRTTRSGSEPLTESMIRLDNRGTALGLFRASSRLLVRELLNTQSLTNTTVFPPSQSASGQAFDAALSICAMLAEQNHFTPSLSNAIFTAAAQANHGGSTQPIEEIFMDFLSLGQRLNWGQLVVFVSRIDDAETLRRLAFSIRRYESRLPILYSAVALSARPDEVGRYLMKFGQTGIEDLAAALRFNREGLNELLRRSERLYLSGQWSERLRSGPLKPFFDFALERSLETPEFALGLKILLYLFGGFLIAAALHVVRPPVAELEKPLQVGGLHVAREILFGLGFLTFVLLITEPFLSQESQRIDFPIRLRLPIMGAAIDKAVTGQHHTSMNKSLLTLVLFFVLQGLLYIACLVKLAEIRRQKVGPRMKLRLLENEEHLFDAGLYLGFAGTIVSLILVSLKVMELSLMAAYGSTSFGIIFVSIFKIFHLRPARRRLLLESESSSETAMMVRTVHSTP